MKKKIGIIGVKGLPAIGGTAYVGQNIIHELKNEYDFTVYGLQDRIPANRVWSDGRQIIFKTFGIKKLNVFMYYIKCLFHVLFVVKYDLIHLHQIDGAFIIPFLRLRYNVIATHHGKTYEVEKWSPTIQRFFLFNEKLLVKFANITTAVSKPLEKYLFDTYHKPVKFVPNGINMQIELGEVEREGYLFFAAARIIPLKGLLVLLDALRTKNINIRLLVAGDLEQMPSHTEEIKKAAKGLDVEFIGLIKEKKLLMAYLKNSRAFIFPSFKEAMSMMLLEAVSVGATIICSDIDANRAVFSEDEVTFFEVGNSDSLAKKIDIIRSNEQSLREKADKAIEKLKNEYCWSTITNQYIELYEQLM